MPINHLLKKNLLAKVANHLVVFFINVLIVRNLSSEDSGLFFNEYYAVSFFAFLFSMGLDYAAISWLSSAPELLPLIYRRLVGIVIVFILSSMLFGMVIFPELSLSLTQPFFGLMLFGSGNLLLIFFQGVLTAQKKFNIQNLVLLGSNLLYAFLLLFLLPEIQSEKINMISMSFGGLVVLQGIMMAFFAYQNPADTAGEINWSKFYRHGIRIMVSSLVYFCFLRIDNFFVEKYCEPQTLSNYLQCGKVGQYFLYFSSVISSTLLPFINTDKIGRSFYEWKLLMRPYIILICVGAILLALLGKYLYPYVFGPDFNEMHQYMLIFLPGYVSLGMLTLMNSIFIGKGNIELIFKGDILGFILVLTCDMMLVPTYGVFAAASISSFAYCVVFFYLWVNFRNQFDQAG